MAKLKAFCFKHRLKKQNYGELIMKSNTKYLCDAAMIAAVYVALSLLFMPISFGPIQCRISEMLTVLPAFLPAAIPGVAIGCLIANILGGAILPDIVFGTFATLIAAVASYKLTAAMQQKVLETRSAGISFRLLAVLPPVISNTIIVPLVLKYAYGYGDALYFMMFTVCIGEIISVAGLGNVLITVAARLPLLLNIRNRETA